MPVTITLHGQAWSVSWRAKNERRVELIRKTTRDTLSAEEDAELQQLQAELDVRLEHWDQPLLGELQRMERAVEGLPDDEN